MRFAFVRWHSFASNEFYKHVLIRTLSIFIAGSFIHAFPFIQQDWDWGNYRIMGVLQRIALAYGISSYYGYPSRFEEDFHFWRRHTFSLLGESFG